MKISELTAYSVYKKAEEEIRLWVEKSYPGLSIEFDPHMEIVRLDKKIKITKGRVRKIVEAVNIKIGDVLEQYAESIYLCELVERIRVIHPDWNGEISEVGDLKKDKQFLLYLKEMHIKSV